MLLHVDIGRVRDVETEALDCGDDAEPGTDEPAAHLVHGGVDRGVSPGPHRPVVRAVEETDLRSRGGLGASRRSTCARPSRCTPARW